MKGLLVAAVMALAPVPAFAHHSFAMYDHTRTVTLKGEVTKFQWTNPHAYLEVDVKQKDGTTKHYSLEMTSINMMTRLGWRSNMIKGGDVVVATVSPLLNGEPAGLLLDVDAAGRQEARARRARRQHVQAHATGGVVMRMWASGLLVVGAIAAAVTLSAQQKAVQPPNISGAWERYGDALGQPTGDAQRRDGTIPPRSEPPPLKPAYQKEYQDRLDGDSRRERERHADRDATTSTASATACR